MKYLSLAILIFSFGCSNSFAPSTNQGKNASSWLLSGDKIEIDESQLPPKVKQIIKDDIAKQKWKALSTWPFHMQDYHSLNIYCAYSSSAIKDSMQGPSPGAILVVRHKNQIYHYNYEGVDFLTIICCIENKQNFLLIGKSTLGTVASLDFYLINKIDKKIKLIGCIGNEGEIEGNISYRFNGHTVEFFGIKKAAEFPKDSENNIRKLKQLLENQMKIKFIFKPVLVQKIEALEKVEK